MVNQSRRMTTCVLLLERVIYGINFYSSTTGSKTTALGVKLIPTRMWWWWCVVNARKIILCFDCSTLVVVFCWKHFQFSVSVWQKKTNKTRVSGRESTPHTKNIRWRSVVSYIPVLEREIVNREQATSEQPTLERIEHLWLVVYDSTDFVYSAFQVDKQRNKYKG